MASENILKIAEILDQVWREEIDEIEDLVRARKMFIANTLAQGLKEGDLVEWDDGGIRRGIVKAVNVYSALVMESGRDFPKLISTLKLRRIG